MRYVGSVESMLNIYRSNNNNQFFSFPLLLIQFFSTQFTKSGKSAVKIHKALKKTFILANEEEHKNSQSLKNFFG